MEYGYPILNIHVYPIPGIGEFSKPIPSKNIFVAHQTKPLKRRLEKENNKLAKLLSQIKPWYVIPEMGLYC